MVFNATSIGVCSRNCISFIISIDIVFVVAMYQNRLLLVVVGIVGALPRVPIVAVPATFRIRW